MFTDISPITNFTENLELYFGDHELGEPKYTVLECKEKDVTYSRPLRVTVRLLNKEAVDKETGEVESIKEQKIFMGDIPGHDPVGTFIINGSERVIVSQIVRSSGVFFSEEVDKKTGSGAISDKVIPTRGAWLEFEIGNAGHSLRQDRPLARKSPLDDPHQGPRLFVTDKQIEELFGETALLADAIDKDMTAELRRRHEGSLLEDPPGRNRDHRRRALVLRFASLRREALRPRRGRTVQDQPETRHHRARLRNLARPRRRRPFREGHRRFPDRRDRLRGEPEDRLTKRASSSCGRRKSGAF
ncbi:MAG: hypothetical protein MZU97_20835 [Bacillus subtilis]|nr:hypothetical protein [Bacillus subtilis]